MMNWGSNGINGINGIMILGVLKNRLGHFSTVSKNHDTIDTTPRIDTMIPDSLLNIGNGIKNS